MTLSSATRSDSSSLPSASNGSTAAVNGDNT